ncbi:MAG: ABC transporter, partial [Acidobacteria bacterium]|nr:ABC transporter [Acidobacteriota bacterium]
MHRGLAQRLSAPGLRFKALSLSSKIALVFIVIIVLSAILAPVISPFSPNSTQFDARLAPNGTNIFGTDQQGRDIFARILVGGRTSLVIGIGAVAMALVVGGIIGSIAATSHKAVNEALMRIMDIFMAFPGIALAAVILTALSDPKQSNTFLIIVAIA